ncbi:hypothetical protein GOC60_17030 [Sinorhizobium meliloti]|nr:hypothetical protein [Sinorhizobium meliloti]MDX0350168.1 hypothetical protein [Sinorhizobium meliloti]
MSRVTISDVRAAGYCVRGAREWFARHGLDFRAFLKHGIAEQEALSSGDAIAAEVIKQKRERDRGF